jgi:DNA-binding transcriptional regulator YdaS (Cro superfamily)
MKPDYPQLDDEALGLLRHRLAHHGGSRAALARELGVSRSGLSQAIDRKYPGDTRHLRALIVERLAEQVLCPHLGVEIAPGVCKAWRERPLSAASASRADVKHWQACQICPFNPARPRLAPPEVSHV